MKLNDKTYNWLKWGCLIAFPALSTLITTIGLIWGIPYYEEIAATVTALGLFGGALIGISTSKYKKDSEESGEDDE